MIAGYTAGVGDWGRDEVFEYAGHLEGSSLASMLALTSNLPLSIAIVLGKRATVSAQKLAVMP